MWGPSPVRPTLGSGPTGFLIQKLTGPAAGAKGRGQGIRGRGQGILGSLSRVKGEEWGRANKESLLQKETHTKKMIQNVHQREKQADERKERGEGRKAPPHRVIRKPAVLEPSIRERELLGRAQGQGLPPPAGPDVLSTPFPPCHQARHWHPAAWDMAHTMDAAARCR